MKVYVVIAKMDGRIENVFVHKSKIKAMKQQLYIAETMAEVIKTECSLIDNPLNRRKVQDLRLLNSSVEVHNCYVEK